MGRFEKAGYDEEFLKAVEEQPREIVMYGLLSEAERYRSYLPEIDWFCNAQGDGRELEGVKNISTAELFQIQNDIYILICLGQDKAYYNEACNCFEKIGLKAKVFNLYDNKSFSFAKGNSQYYPESGDKRLKVRIINYDPTGWILTKFSERLNESLQKMGIDSDIGCEIDPSADINHHIPFHPYRPQQCGNDTLMITHVDTKLKIDLLAHQLKTAKMGICMSRETMDMLAGNGIPRNKLCYINPAHDGNMSPKKYVLGITHKCHDIYDYRKRLSSLLDIAQYISPAYFKFVIMGSGWEAIIERLREMGFEVDYYSEFQYELYHQIMPTFDYYLFFGFDEGSMGYLDALAAGVKTIVTPQGYHLDVKDGIDYACSTIEDFANVLLELQYAREKKIASVAEWTWDNYAKKHIEVWNYLLKRQPLGEILKNQLWYRDGIFSCLLEDNKVPR